MRCHRGLATDDTASCFPFPELILALAGNGEVGEFIENAGRPAGDESKFQQRFSAGRPESGCSCGAFPGFSCRPLRGQSSGLLEKSYSGSALEFVAEGSRNPPREALRLSRTLPQLHKAFDALLAAGRGLAASNAKACGDAGAVTLFGQSRFAGLGLACGSSRDGGLLGGLVMAARHGG